MHGATYASSGQGPQGEINFIDGENVRTPFGDMVAVSGNQLQGHFNRLIAVSMHLLQCQKAGNDHVAIADASAARQAQPTPMPARPAAGSI